MEGSVQIYYGDGRGKTTAALGLGIRAAGIGKQVIMIQFLKSRHSNTLEYLKKLEPELQIFRFERSDKPYSELSEEEKQEQHANIKNGLLYARKVLSSEQCDLLILDEVLGLIDYGIITEEGLNDLLSLKDETVDVVLTGRHLYSNVAKAADAVYYIHTEKEDHASILFK